MEGFRNKGLRIRVEKLVKIYKMGPYEVQALRGLSLEVEPGTALAVMGPSGSGKTTLLNLIGGVDRPTGGKIVVGDVTVTWLSEEELGEYRLRTVGYVFQTFNLVPQLTALENVEIPLIAAGTPREERRRRAEWLLSELGLGDRAHHRPGELSGGEQQRVAIAVALANDPPVILADEPTAELDWENAKKITELLVSLAEDQGKTVIIATHDPRVAMKTHRIVRLEDGVLRGIYRPLELTEKPAAGSLAETVRARLGALDRELEEAEKAYREGRISLVKLVEIYRRVERLREALEDLLSSLGEH